MSISQIIFDTTTKKLLDFKNVHKYKSYYHSSFNKIVNFVIESLLCTYKINEMYF